MRPWESLHQKKTCGFVSPKNMPSWAKKTSCLILVEARVWVQLDVGTFHLQPSKWALLDLGEYTATHEQILCMAPKWTFLFDLKRHFWKSSSPKQWGQRGSSCLVVDFLMFRFQFPRFKRCCLLLFFTVQSACVFWLTRFLKHRVSLFYFWIDVQFDKQMQNYLVHVLNSTSN